MPFWRRQPRQETRSVISVSDPALQAYFGLSTPVLSGVVVGESGSLSLSAVWRAVSLISQSIGQLPLKTYRDTAEGERAEVGSIFDDPGGEQLTRFEWVELILTHLLLHGNAFLLHIYGGAGQLVALQPIHPWAVAVEMTEDGSKRFTVQLENGDRRTLTSADMTHIPGLSVDGVCGLSVISVARNSLGTAIAADRAAARWYGNGAMMSGIVTPEPGSDLTLDEAKQLKEGLDRKVAGHENAGQLVVTNKSLRFQAWTMSADDAQFIQSRQFEVEEIARWFGTPPHLLMQVDKQSSWAAGIEAQNRGLARSVLAPWCRRIESRLSRLLPAPRFVEFDMAGLERGTPAEEINLLIQQVQAGLLTVNEARAIRNLPPLPDSVATTPASPPPADPTAGPVAEVPA